jgi:hypothetical protein
MNLPPDFLRKLETEEGLEAVMAQAAVITAGDVAAAKTAHQPVTATVASQGTSTASQPPRQKTWGERKSRLISSQVNMSSM